MDIETRRFNGEIPTKKSGQLRPLGSAIGRLTTAILIVAATTGLSPTPASADNNLPGCIPPETWRLFNQIPQAGQIIECPQLFDNTGTTRENTSTGGSFFVNGINHITAFTDGTRTWQISPYGQLATRGNGELFPWEQSSQPTTIQSPQIITQPMPQMSQTASVSVETQGPAKIRIELAQTYGPQTYGQLPHWSCPNGWQPYNGLGNCRQVN